jgi:hypothetical protein
VRPFAGAAFWAPIVVISTTAVARDAPSACGAEQYRLVRDNGIAAAPFGGIERAVRRLDQTSGQQPVPRDPRLSADADDDDAACRIIMGNEKGFDGLTRFFGKRGRALDIKPRQQQCELSVSPTERRQASPLT